MRNKRKQTSKEKKLEEKIENLRQQGFYFPPNIQSSNKPTPENKTRLIRRIADWWETTSIEKFLEDINYLLKNSAILEIIGLLANITIIVSLVSWLTGLKEQQENKLFATWTIINDGKGDRSGVVRTAVERLHREGFSLLGLQLNQTNLIEANLSKANLSLANLSQAKLDLANLSQANLGLANLSQADLFRANLSKADLHGANLSQADLHKANLSQADLRIADFSETSLLKANLRGANLHGAKIFNTKNLSNTQIKLACNWKEATYVNSTIVENNLNKIIEYDRDVIFEKEIESTRFEFQWIPEDKQANQEKIKEIEQDKDSDPKNPPNCSRWKKD